MAWRLIRHSFSMIFGNFGQALKVSAIPYGLLVLAAILFLKAVGISAADYHPNLLVGPESRLSASESLLLLAFMAFTFFVMSWVSVAWHRFILNEEYTAILPVILWTPIWQYTVRTIQLGFLAILFALPVFFIIGVILNPVVANGVGVFYVLIVLTGLSLIAAFWMRFAIILPAASIGAALTFRQAWVATKEMSNAIFGAAFFLVSLNILPNVILEGVFIAYPTFAMVTSTALQWFSMMAGLSILTTIYGHVIQGRPLVA